MKPYEPYSYVVYISGPITRDKGEHLRAALHAANRLLGCGISPIVPQLNILWSLIDPPEGERSDPHGTWLPPDLALVKRSDAVLRLPGESAGADIEVEFAVANDIPVFYNLDTLLGYFSKERWLQEVPF